MVGSGAPAARYTSHSTSFEVHWNVAVRSCPCLTASQLTVGQGTHRCPRGGVVGRWGGGCHCGLPVRVPCIELGCRCAACAPGRRLWPSATSPSSATAGRGCCQGPCPLPPTPTISPSPRLPRFLRFRSNDRADAQPCLHYRDPLCHPWSASGPFLDLCQLRGSTHAPPPYWPFQGSMVSVPVLA